MIDEETLVQLEKAWTEQGECLSCGWWPAFYEVADLLIEDSPRCFTAPCISKDDNDSWCHRGHWIHLKD